MKYTAVSFSSSRILDWQKDLLIAELGEIGFDTFEEAQDGFVAYIPSANLDVALLDTLLIREAVDYDVDYQVQDLDDQNWNILWESNFNPIVIDNRCYVRATFHEARPNFDYEIVIDPKMSFGTGHHQTTSMMLSYLLDHDVRDRSVLDMGCGTGILAVLAAKKGASSVLAVDYDEICIASVEENKALNNTNHIESLLGSREVIEGRHIDVILANINRNILLDQFEQYNRILNANGMLFISGFYDGEDLDILTQEATRLGLSFKDKKVLDNWCAAMFVKD